MANMQMLKYELIFNWIALFFYLIATVFFIRHAVPRREKSLGVALRLTMIGLIPHAVGLGIRWYAVGHGPYLEKMESFSSTVGVCIIMFLFFAYKVPRLKSIGLVVLPCCVVMMVIGLAYSPWVTEILARLMDNGPAGQGISAGAGSPELPPTFTGIWFISHISSTIVAVGAILIALGTALFYLAKGKKAESGFMQSLPSLELLDTYSYMFAGLGFTFWTIMIITGALWADQSWGRYWAWDPIETWSLITWLLFGIYLHLRRFFKWQGQRAAWLMVVCFVFSIITLFVIPFLSTTIHLEYFL